MSTTNRKSCLLCAAVAAVVMAAPASGMGMGQAMGTNQGNGGALYSELGPKGNRPAQFLPQFVELTQADFAANATLLTSLGLADDAARSASQSAGFSVETTPGKIEAAVGSVAAAHQLVLKKLATSPALTPENQAMFAAGALLLAQTAKGYASMTGDFVAVKKALFDAGAKARLALYAAKTMPPTVAQVREELQAIVVYAKAINITLAAEVSEAAAAM